MEKIENLIEKLSENRKLFFIVIILICILAIALGIYGQFFYKYSDTDPFMFRIHIGGKKSAEEYAELKSNFLNIFTNEVHINSESIRIDKIETSQSIIYTGYNIENEDDAYYQVNLKLPILNINKTEAKLINTAIKERFSDEAAKIMRSSSGYTTYNVSYVAYVNENIVSIVIKENSKYVNSSETTTIKTYNYNIATNEEVSLEELIQLKGLDKSVVQENIDETIKTSHENAKALANEFGTTITRDPSDQMYKIQNTEVYFLTDDGYIYIIYPYGETEETNEMDIIIF